MAATLRRVQSGDAFATVVRQIHARGGAPEQTCADTCLRHGVNAAVITDDLPRLNEYSMAVSVACYWNNYEEGKDWFYLGKADDGDASATSVNACADLCIATPGCTGFEFVADEYCASWMNYSCYDVLELHFLFRSTTITGFVSKDIDEVASCVDEASWVSNTGLTCRDYALLSICSYYPLSAAGGWGDYTDAGAGTDGDVDFLHRDANGVPVTEACCACKLAYDLVDTQLEGDELQTFEARVASVSYTHLTLPTIYSV